MEDFLEDIGAEMEINPDEVVNKKKPRKTRLLRKDEKKALLDMLTNVASNGSDSVVSAVIAIVNKEDHIHMFEERKKLWSSLQSAQLLMSTLVKGLTEMFIHIYKSCQTGKDKYSRFQLDWHKQCSLLLKAQVDQGGQKELTQIHQRWVGYCEGSGVSKEVYNSVMIAVYSAVFGYLMQLVAKHQKDHLADSGHESGQAPLLADQEGVYYRFGGAALSAMLHLRYDQLKSGVHELKREAVKDEITILKAIQCTDKHHVPDYLQYRDRGYMYFPAARYIPFIRNVDTCVLDYANESSFTQHDSRHYCHLCHYCHSMHYHTDSMHHCQHTSLLSQYALPSRHMRHYCHILHYCHIQHYCHSMHYHHNDTSLLSVI